MSNRFFIEQMKRRGHRAGMRGEYIPDPGGSGGITPAQAMATQQFGVPQPSNPGPGPSNPLMPLGRKLTYEESIGRLLWKRRRTPDGGNHLNPPEWPKAPINVRRAPWLDLPASGEPYIEPNRSAIVIGAVGTTTVVVSFQVPKRKNGNIEWIANQFIGGGDVEGTGVIRWQILLDGVPAKNYNNIPATIGTMTNPADLRESPIRIFENQQVKLVCVNVAFVANQEVLNGMFRGKFWPIEQEGPNTWV